MLPQKLRSNIVIGKIWKFVEQIPKKIGGFYVLVQTELSPSTPKQR